jgi:predicted HTH domain antitoxin
VQNTDFTSLREEVEVQSIHRVRKTDLARNTRRVINDVLRGQTAVVESHGQPEVAIMDIIDYRITRAVMRYYSRQPEIDVEAGLSDQQAAIVSEPQERFNLVLAHYLAGAISLGRAAELLELPWLDLRTRLLRLDVPLRTAPADLSEAETDLEVAETWPTPQQG